MPATVAFILEHGEAKVLITDREFSGIVAEALAKLKTKPLVIDIDDPLAPPGERLGDIDYESFLASGDPDFAWDYPADEWDAIALNYTSGTTGNPKGVVLASSRRLSQRDRQSDRVEHAAPSRLPLDLADVPLQRLVLSVDDCLARRHECVPAARRLGRDLRRDRARTA